jgi:hypothetical protein
VDLRMLLPKPSPSGQESTRDRSLLILGAVWRLRIKD